MTLYQMSYVYREDALRFRMRITVLREQAKAAEGEDKLRLKRRIWSCSSFCASRVSWRT